MAFVCWSLGAMALKSRGVGYGLAMTIAAVLTLGGLLAWFAYHLASGHADGLMIGGMTSLFRVMTPPGAGVETDLLLCVGIATYSIGCFGLFGFGLRLWSRRRSALKPAGTPFWDTELDRSRDGRG